MEGLEAAYNPPPPFWPFTEDIRNYHYDRSRYGFDGELDYKLGDMSSVYLRGIFSHFNDYGEDWVYTPTFNNLVADPSTCSAAPATAFSGPIGCAGMSFPERCPQPAH